MVLPHRHGGERAQALERAAGSARTRTPCGRAQRPMRVSNDRAACVSTVAPACSALVDHVHCSFLPVLAYRGQALRPASRPLALHHDLQR